MKRTMLVNLICSLTAVLVIILGVLFVIVFNDTPMFSNEKLIISSESSTAVYNGKPLTNGKWHISSGELKNGHKLVVEVSGVQTDVGISENTIFAKVLDSNGADVSDKYNLECLPGTLNVRSRDINIVANSAMKKYDGTPLTDSGYSLQSDVELISGHNLAVTVEGSITEIGEADNNITAVAITNAYGVDVTRNYSVRTYKGMLIVHDGINIPGGGSGGGSGDGSGGDSGGGTSGGLNMSGSLSGDNSGDELIFTVFSDYTAKVYLKVQSFGDYNKSEAGFEGAPVYNTMINTNRSAYYLVPYALDNSGLTLRSMTITPKVGLFALPYYSSDDQFIQSSDTDIIGDASDAYNVKHYGWSNISGAILPSRYSAYEKAYGEFVRQNYLAVDDQTAEYMNSIIEKNGFSLSDKEVINKVAKYIRSAADYNLDYDKQLDSDENPVIAFLSTYKEGVCRHYAAAATMLYRTLGIPARYTVGFVASAKSGEEVNVLSKNAHAWVEVYVDGLGWVYVEVTGSSRSSDSVIKLELSPVDVRELYSEGTVLKAKNEVKGFTIASAGYRYVATVDGSIDGLGIALSNISELEIYDSNGDLVYKKTTGLGENKFKIEYRTGVVQQYLSKLTFTSTSKSKTYDGIPLTTLLSDCSMTDGDIHAQLGYSYVITPTGKADTVGTVSSSFKVTVYKNGVDCTSHFAITTISGNLTLNAKNITVSAKSGEKEFDGTPLVMNNIVFDPSMLAEGDEIIEFVVVGSQTNIGKSANVLRSIKIVNKDGKDVTENYKITIEDGLLVVKIPTK